MMAVQITFRQGCPHCGETCFVSGGFVTIDHGFATQEIRCDECGTSYQEVYEYKYTVTLHDGADGVEEADDDDG